MRSGWASARLGPVLGLALVACAQPARTENWALIRSATAPRELAILPLEVRGGGAAPAEALREALAAAAVDAGFSPLGRRYVDTQTIDPDVPALGEAGVLRVRLLDWSLEPGPPVRQSARLHVSLYQAGELLADLQYRDERRAASGAVAADPRVAQAALRAEWAAELLSRLPGPPPVELP